jgi:hypothetical protein
MRTPRKTPWVEIITLPTAQTAVTSRPPTINRRRSKTVQQIAGRQTGDPFADPED